MIITICSSADFYKHTMEVAEQLEAAGHTVLVPENAITMKKSGNFRTADYKTWLTDPSSFHRKKAFMDGHFAEVRKADAILVVNDHKRGIDGYIGGNVLMEMSLAYFESKPIYILNPVEDMHPFYEEVVGMGAKNIDGDLSKIK